MREPILHHYDLSPYAEKIRLVFGLKELAWASVRIPVVMPKPDLTELTGGYRRTPVLQLGADIYCDTRACARALERLKPRPTLFPGDETAAWGLSRWAESSFLMGVTVFLGLGDVFDDAFLEDRKKMAPHLDFSQAPRLVPAKLLQLRANLDRLERQLADGRPFLLGDAPSLADLSAHHPHAFLERHAKTRSLLEAVPRVGAWLERVAAIGHGKRRELDAADAIAVARDAEPAPVEDEPLVLPDGMQAGDPVVVIAEEGGSGTVRGELVASGVHEIAVRRRSDRAGDLVVHFPRDEYLVLRAG